MHKQYKRQILMDKFESVKIENNTRLCDEDRIYCESQYNLYCKVLTHMDSMFKKVMILQSEDLAFYQSVQNENKSSDGYAFYSYQIISLKTDDYIKQVKDEHQNFCNIIKNYFRHKYDIKIDEIKYETLIDFNEPKEPDYPYGSRWNSNPDDEAVIVYNDKKIQYKQEYNLYIQNILDLRLDFNLVVDKIFITLDGFSFSEKVEQEIKENARKAIIWGYAKDNIRFSLKNGKISFEILNCYKCPYMKRYEIKLDGDDYQDILRALTYFDTDGKSTSIYRGWRNNFVYYQKLDSDGIFDLHKVGSNKVTHFKYFKNGKFEVTFDNHVNALKFAKEFLGYSQ